MVVAYYTSTSFMDVFIEIIQSIKHEVELHVFIEISNESKTSTIVDVESISEANLIEKPENILGIDTWKLYKPYFEGVASVQFVVYKSKRSLSINTLHKSYLVGKYLKKLQIDIVHFDTVSLRSIGLYKYLREKNIIIALHDPIPHLGEYNWREDIPGLIYYKRTKGFIFYSNYSSNQFKENFQKITTPNYIIRLQNYSFIQKISSKPIEPTYLLFFGRLSYYKGIDLLLEAIPIVLKKYPDEKFKIVGKPSFDYKVNKAIIEKYSNNITIEEKHVKMIELKELIQNSKFIICPYREATQSGVAMTSFAVGKAIVATNVGSFPEYIKNNINGILSEPNAISIANKIIEALTNNKYKELENNIIKSRSENTLIENRKVLLSAYSYCLDNNRK